MAEGVFVIGVDLEEPGDGAIRAALRRFAAPRNASLHFVFAADAAALPDAFDEREFDSDEELVESARGLVAQRIERIAKSMGLDLSDLHFHIDCAVGKPVAVLLAMCGRHDPELLIVGTHGRRGFERFVAGSVAETMVREAPCDVLVARASSAPTRQL